MNLSKSRFKLCFRIVLTAIIVAFSTPFIQAQNFQISGGHNQSVMICANSRVYAWGKNDAGGGGSGFPAITGSRGTGNTVDANILTPEEVTLPPGVTVEQVDAGSGGHVLALACDGTVYAWGGNENGEVGGVAASAAVTTPVQVPTGEQGHGSGLLSNVINVSGGNDESYVILNTGEVMTWGQNAQGQLGNGTTTPSITPVYVRIPGGATLQDVIKVEAGDATGYALVDTDGDGVGEVYSWGDDINGILGRPSVNKNFAAPVEFPDGSPLGGIVSISAGDVHCLALDTAGIVWAWGNGAWGGLTGTNGGFGETHVDPRRVVGGETGQPYLTAVAISAGQGFSMAVTADGHAVAWGNDGEGDTGGSLGNCADGASHVPQYIDEAGGVPTTNVVNISDGDTWGFLIKGDNTFWAWGNNSWGQLGLGNTTDNACLVQFTPPGTCGLPDLEPYVNLQQSFSTCPAVDTLLNSNFPGGANYTITWYHNGSPVGSNPTYNANDFGDYEVEVAYTGSDAPCGGYDPVSEEMSITQWSTMFSDPGSQTFCDDTICGAVSGGVGEYVWYTEPTGGAILDTSVGSGPACFHHMDVTHTNPGSPPFGSGSQFTVYVEESGNVFGTLAEMATTDISTTTNTISSVNIFNRIVAYEDIHLKSLKFQWAHPWGQGSWTGQIGIYGQRTGCGADVISDPGNLIALGPMVTIDDMTDNDQNTMEEEIVDMNNLLLPGSDAGEVYWIGFAVDVGQPIMQLNGNTFPYVDNVTGTIAQVDQLERHGCNATGGGVYGPFYDIAFATAPKACGRIPVTLEASCPLPVEFLAFTGWHENGVNKLTWATISETNNAYFTIQRSVDGIHFEDLQVVNGAINSTSLLEYRYDDKKPFSGVNYYRIKQTDIDGGFAYSKIVSVNNNTNEVLVFPNPTHTTFNVSIGGGAEVRIEVVDALGKLHESTYGNDVILGEKLPKGSYFVRVYINDKVIVKPVIKF